MKKGFFMIKPSNFVRLGKIDIDGNYDYVQCEDFKVKEPKENYLIFEMRYEEDTVGRQYYGHCREIVSGKRFALNFDSKKDKTTGKVITTVVLESDKVGLYSIVPLNLSDIECDPSRVSGLFDHFLKNPEEKDEYCSYLKGMIYEAETYKKDYDINVDGPCRQNRRSLKKAFHSCNPK